MQHTRLYKDNFECHILIYNIENKIFLCYNQTTESIVFIINN